MLLHNSAIQTNPFFTQSNPTYYARVTTHETYDSYLISVYLLFPALPISETPSTFEGSCFLTAGHFIFRANTQLGYFHTISDSYHAFTVCFLALPFSTLHPKFPHLTTT